MSFDETFDTFYTFMIVIIILFFTLVIGGLTIDYQSLKSSCQSEGLFVAYNEHGCVNSRGDFYNAYNKGVFIPDYIISDEETIGVKVK